MPRLESRPADDAAFLQGIFEGFAGIEAQGYVRLAVLGAPKDRIVGIGDSLEHDIAGPAGFGIDAVLIRRGVSADFTQDALIKKAPAGNIRLTAIVDELA